MANMIDSSKTNQLLHFVDAFGLIGQTGQPLQCHSIGILFYIPLDPSIDSLLKKK